MYRVIATDKRANSTDDGFWWQLKETASIQQARETARKAVNRPIPPFYRTSAIKDDNGNIVAMFQTGCCV